jgi:peptidyl-tRNA hydrolase, PTH1 family
MKIIAGLGNPGERYAATRHNLGFRVADGIAEKLNASFDREKQKGLLAQGAWRGERVTLIKPQTFMNLSGECVGPLTRNLDSFENLLVIVDDVALTLGRVRLRPGGSAGGHNGLKSIIERCGTNVFHRLRLGVGMDRRDGDLADYVLAKFHPDEFQAVNAMIERAVEAALCWAAEGMNAAMDRYNRDGAPPAASGRNDRQ